MKECKAFMWYLLCQLGNLLSWSIKHILRLCLRIDRYVIKRYFGLETPFYKIWWRNHAVVMQRKLDKIHNKA